MRTFDQNMLDVMRARDERILRERQNQPPVSSGFTSETLKQAIADAKEVRKQALRNAKIALEEAFGKRFEDMFAEKLYREGENVYERDDTKRNP
jgi:tRNA A37 N6-isopentenylltransferase MiaA